MITRQSDSALNFAVLESGERAVESRHAIDRRLRAIVSEHFEATWRFLRRLGVPEGDVDDAVQEVILVVARGLERIEPGRERAFMFGSAYRIALNVRRARARRRETCEDGLEWVVDPADDPERLTQQKQARVVLDGILERMPFELRAVFVLYEIDGLTMAEIAESLQLAPGTVASRLRRGRAEFCARVARLERRGQGEDR